MPTKGRPAAGMGSFVFKAPLQVSCELKNFPGGEGAWKSLVKHYLKSMGMPKATLSLLLCGDAKSRALNRDWRRKDKATDVLSFPLNEGRTRAGFNGPLGDIALNLSYTRRERGRFAPTLNGEAAFLLLHGLLHLTGLHHDNPRQEAAMWRQSLKHFPPPARLLRRLGLND